MEFPFATYDKNYENNVNDPLLEAAEASDNENQDPGVITTQPGADTLQGDALLVTLVEGYPILYDKNLPDYKNGNMRECSWMQIGSIMELSAWDCSKRWAQLRESFCREKRKRVEESRSGSGASKRKGFVLFEAMRFLENHVTKRKTFSNVGPSPRSSTDRTPLFPLTMDENVQTYGKYLLAQPNMVMPRTLTNIPLVMPSLRFTLAASTPLPRFNTPPPIPTPPLNIQTETCSPQTPIATPPLWVPTPPASDRSTSSSLGPMSPLVACSPATDKSTPSCSGSDSRHGYASQSTLTSQRLVENDMDTRFFPRTQSSPSWRNDNIIKDRPSPPCKLTKLNACYNKELSKAKKIHPIQSSFMSLSSAIQDHLTNSVGSKTGKQSISSTSSK